MYIISRDTYRTKRNEVQQTSGSDYLVTPVIDIKKFKKVKKENTDVLNID